MTNTFQEETSNPRARQQKLLILILLSILGACIVLGWWMTRRIDAPTTQGIEIVRAVRARKLLQFPGGNKTYRQHYFIYQHAGGKPQIVGWRFRYHSRNQNPEKGFVGGEMEWNPGSYAQSRWTLTDGLDKGSYQSRIERRKRDGLIRTGASIELNNGILYVQQILPGHKLNSECEIPDNYIPEGSVSLMLREVAERKTHAKFKMIFDSLPPVGSRPRFGILEVRYIKPPEDDSGGAELEIRQITPSRKSTYRVVLDSAGNVAREIAGNMKTIPVSEKMFSEVFPYDAEHLRNTSPSELSKPQTKKRGQEPFLSEDAKSRKKGS